MLLNLETDYAIRIVGCLAKSDERIDAKTIAARTGVTPKFTLKILHKLCGGGIVKSFKGAKGGYTLNRPSNEITLLEVVELVYGSLSLKTCNAGDCTHPNGMCKFKDVFDNISDHMRESLSKITFETY